MKQLIQKIGPFYGIVILLAATLITSAVNTSLINYNSVLTRENQAKIIGLLNSTSNVLNATHTLAQQGTSLARFATQNQAEIVKIINGTSKELNATNRLINVEGNFSLRQAATDRSIIKSIADSLRNTNNQTTQEFFTIARTNGKLMQDVLANVTALKH